MIWKYAEIAENESPVGGSIQCLKCLQFCHLLKSRVVLMLSKCQKCQSNSLKLSDRSIYLFYLAGFVITDLDRLDYIIIGMGLSYRSIYLDLDH